MEHIVSIIVHAGLLAFGIIFFIAFFRIILHLVRNKNLKSEEAINTTKHDKVILTKHITIKKKGFKCIKIGANEECIQQIPKRDVLSPKDTRELDFTFSAGKDEPEIDLHPKEFSKNSSEIQNLKKKGTTILELDDIPVELRDPILEDGSRVDIIQGKMLLDENREGHEGGRVQQAQQDQQVCLSWKDKQDLESPMFATERQEREAKKRVSQKGKRSVKEGDVKMKIDLRIDM